MRRRPFRALVPSLLMTVLLFLSPETSAAGGDASELEAHIEQAIALRRSGQDREALGEFQQAELISPDSARVQAHLAGTYQALGDWLRADEYMKRALAQTADLFVQRHRETLELALQKIEEHIGQLEVDGSPVGAEVRIDGQLKGALPLRQPIRTLAGSYTLELSRRGYYGVRRPVIVVGAQLTREVVHLSADVPASEPAPRSTPGIAPDTSSSTTSWLPWALGGLGLAAGGVSTVSWLARERHAERWNDDARCQRAGQTRDDVCGTERVASERAQTIMLVSAAAGGVFAVGAVLSVVLGTPATRQTDQAELACALEGVWLTCAGRF